MRQLLFFGLILLCFSCHSIKAPDKPKNLIAKEKMADIIFDMVIVNSAKGNGIDILKANGIVPEQYIYEKYNIDSIQFIASNAYYAYQVKDYREIYDSINKKLERLKANYDTIAETIEKINDSLIAPPEIELPPE